MTATEARDYIRLATETATGREAIRNATGLTSTEAVNLAADRLADAEAIQVAHEVAVLVCRKVGL